MVISGFLIRLLRKRSGLGFLRIRAPFVCGGPYNLDDIFGSMWAIEVHSGKTLNPKLQDLLSYVHLVQ